MTLVLGLPLQKIVQFQVSIKLIKNKKVINNLYIMYAKYLHILHFNLKQNKDLQIVCKITKTNKK